MSDNLSPLQPQWQSKVWKQFLTAKKEMLHAYDCAREKGLERPVRTEHGKVAEAAFRKWFLNFLPKRYGVTAGYIISQGMLPNEKLVHYDVIIYDQLEAPILWIDDNPDSSGQGSSMAIPVEYVRGVFEVKSSFNKSTVAEAISHLGTLKPLLQRIDDPQQATKLYLPREFFCGVVFFELRKENDKDFKALDAFLKGVELRGFYGGFILRNETLDEQYSGKLSVVWEAENSEYNNKSLSFWSCSQSIKRNESPYCKVLLNYCESYFSQFSFDIIALLKGEYHPALISSLYGMGTTSGHCGKTSSIQYFDSEEYKNFEEMTAKYLDMLDKSDRPDEL